MRGLNEFPGTPGPAIKQDSVVLFPLLTSTEVIRCEDDPTAGPGPHAAVRCGADERRELEHLCRSITRPAIATELLKRNGAGQVVLQLKSAYQDGATQVVRSPLEFMQRLAALVPRPRLPLIRFHGVLAPNAKLRAAIVPPPAHSTHAAEHAHHSPARMSWARLLNGSSISTSNTTQTGAGA